MRSAGCDSSPMSTRPDHHPRRLTGQRGRPTPRRPLPRPVHAVIASVPANIALCAYPGCGGPAWTLHGKPLPYTRQFNQPHPTDDPAAAIPVEQIRGPIFLDCAGVDTVWNSCAYAQAIMQRLEANNFRYPHVLYRSPRAGHRVGGLLPYEPDAIGNDPETRPRANGSGRTC